MRRSPWRVSGAGLQRVNTRRYRMHDAPQGKSFLFATWEGGGSVTPALTVAKKLSDRGHRVRVMSDRCNRPEAEAAGAIFVPWTRAPSRLDRSKDSDIRSEERRVGEECRSRWS